MPTSFYNKNLIFDMINNLNISYTLGGNISVTLSTGTVFDDNLPYDLASLFARVIDDSSANAEMVIDNLKNELDVEC